MNQRNTIKSDTGGSKLSPVELTARQYTDADQFSSVEWAVSKNGKPVSQGHAGFANAALKTPVPDAAIYRIYSMTKPLVSVAALMLLEQQKLKLYEPVARYIPAFAKQKILLADGSLQHNPVPATIEHLLTHRAGLSYDFLPGCKVGERYRELALAEDGSRRLPELVACLADTPAACVPGERWHYSYATDVLAHVIELASGQSIADYLQQHLTGPLGMTDTRYCVKPADLPRLMPMYGARCLGSVMGPPPETQELSEMDVEQAYPSSDQAGFLRGGVGLFSTTRDYMAFAEFMRNGNTADGRPLVSPATFDLLWSNRIDSRLLPLKIGPNALPGYGWNLAGRVMLDIGQAQFVTSKGEGGWAGAASTYFWVDRARAISGVVMSQYLGSALPLGPDMHSAASIEFSGAA